MKADMYEVIKSCEKEEQLVKGSRSRMKKEKEKGRYLLPKGFLIFHIHT